MGTSVTRSSTAALILGAAALCYGSMAGAASCCGGGSASSLVMPKFSKAMLNLSFDIEQYHGYWNNDGEHIPDPPGTDLNQYRLNLGYAHRLASRWQASVVLPYVWNDNVYAGLESRTNGIGDSKINFWYEAFDNVMCVWKVRGIKDLKPASYLGFSMTVPTGISPYDNVENSFDITGRGFYRLDGNIFLDKTVYPWNASLLLSYGKYIERSVNREYGNYVEPYRKQLGDRAQAALSFGYTQFLQSMNSITYTIGYSDIWEDEGTINGQADPTSGMRKKSVAGTIAFSTMDREWIIKGIWNHAIQKDGWGKNFPTTNIYTVEVVRVFR